jgi:cardiolipin synthase
MILQSIIANISSHPFWTVFIHVSSLIGFILGIILITQILRNPRKPSATIGWLLIIVLLPVIGIPLYLIFGDRKFNKLKNKKGVMTLPQSKMENENKLNVLLISLGLPSASEGNSNVFHKDGKQAWQELVKLLQEAQHSIDMAIFILADDKVGDQVLSILEQKAANGIKVRLLLDGVGSMPLAKKVLHPLEKNGGQVAWFIPVLHLPFRGRTNLRNHRKIIIADHSKVWTGGRNLAEEYIGDHCPDSCWIDLSVTQQGSIVNVYQAVFDADWDFANYIDSDVMLENTKQPSVGNSLIQIIPSGPDVADDPIYVALLSACYAAKKRISIVTPYFIPNSGLQEALKLAALRGVEVNLILPEKSNHRLADIARGRYLRELNAVGVKIWLIPNKMIHAKAVVFDDDFAMTGSANLDIRSLFLNCEIMSGYYSHDDIEWLSAWIEGLRQQADIFHPPPVSALREMFEGIVLLSAYQL